ncbi:uncharacterized protein [Oryza sativa Japonica Group]|uniref:Os08g0113900 protein n=4 Tax=Oryza TaxID=4527 RepID=A0A0P0XB97_ORYSJ|nr:uncharacterized protein LOC4344505 [Oryza sativa Japonica Group]XP_052166458.1 uncharacterized protein LOC127783261 [Oryza glaberrima]EEC82810.1 hypothetical protein OsI_27586 [Oryza sativa Indica Group]KAB8107160.1 hypothetical protein EE612_041766 [Oryza sativa]EEE67934.1 hypothetical protein OsJ_25810 [Oryza sativa Japonica Group]KAF2917814.1 hypothetical protein DAI22_08g010766 [Oryza sativa Japonica Group]BAD10551.1 unknown protein [Oryza sativa Japonica Group]|eukprot:NP_001060845.1 Os08g0113900 [Oryza sativa Japonica Group]
MDDDEKPPAAAAGAIGGEVAAGAVAVDACLVAAAMAGASLLAWWAVAFHPSNSRLWMVPVGLVLACTPAIVYLALSLQPPSTVSDHKGSHAAGHPPPPPPLSMVVIDK